MQRYTNFRFSQNFHTISARFLQNFFRPPRFRMRLENTRYAIGRLAKGGSSANLLD